MAFNEFNDVMCGTRSPKQSRTSPALPQTLSMVYPPVPVANAVSLNYTSSLCLPIQDQGPCGKLILHLIFELMLKL